MIAPAPAPMPIFSFSPLMPSLSIACVTVARIGYERPLIVMRSNATCMLPLRSMRPALFTELTTPRASDPAGTTTRPSASLRSTTVVASNRSSTCEVAELSGDWSRTSNSVPTATSLGFCVRPAVPAGYVRPSLGRVAGGV